MINFDYMLKSLLEDGEDIVDDLSLNSFVLDVLNGHLDTNDDDIRTDILNVIAISNILYNNTDRTLLPLEDGIYDKLVVLANNLGLNPMVGAPSTDIHVTNSALRSPFVKCDELLSPFVKLDESKLEAGLFIEDLVKEPYYIKEDFFSRALIPTEVAKKKLLNIPHEYPKLVGTLDKCKFVLDKQAYEAGVLNDANVSIFERDFLRPHLEMGLFGPNDRITMLATLKMDGVSVEATVTDRIISARSRGDTANDIASDLTPALKGYTFPRATNFIKDPEDAFGIKFECMLSYDALNRLSAVRNVEYKNPRNAIIGLLGAGDCNQWLEYITLIPLETSLDINPIEEIIMLNALYAKEPLRYAIISGTYNEVLFQVKKFVEEAEYLRPIMPYMYDGVVLTYVDKDIREKLGRVNSVNKYSIAIKFNPMKKQTKFLGYTYSIGQNGVVTPIAHYYPVELLGATHEKTTVHSYARFQELELREGDIVSIQLMNDVIPYITKEDIYDNELNHNPIIEFPSYCPSCGTKLELSTSGKSMFCPNTHCPERRLALTTNMLAKLGFKDFSEKSLAMLDCIYSLKDLINIDPSKLDILGPTEKQNFLARIDELINSNMWDYRLVGALGFTNIAAERWSTILKKISLSEIIYDEPVTLNAKLLSIKGIGKSMIETIITEREFLKEDLIMIDSNVIPNKKSFGTSSGLQIRFSGVRDEELMLKLQELGYDCTGGGVTKQTNILLVPYLPYKSSKTAKLSAECKLIALDEFKLNMNKYLM